MVDPRCRASPSRLLPRGFGLLCGACVSCCAVTSVAPDAKLRNSQKPRGNLAKLGPAPLTQILFVMFGQARSKELMEQEGMQLAEETGLDVFWRPKQDVKTLANVAMRKNGSSVLGFQRDIDYCARVGPNAMCFCGFCFQQHAPSARLADADGFGWKKSLHNMARAHNPKYDWSFADDIAPENDTPCSRFRFFPCTAAERSTLDMREVFQHNRVKDVSLTEEEKRQGVEAGLCMNCGLSPTVHNVETLLCPMASTQPGANRTRTRYESAWECVVCDRKWEDHETVVQLREELDPYQVKAPNDARVIPLGQILNENSYGLLGNYRDSDHYLDKNLKHRIARENDAFREQLKMPARGKCIVPAEGRPGLHVERFFDIPLRGKDALPTMIDTSGAFQGRGSMAYGNSGKKEDDVGSEFVGQRADGSWSHIC
ncbi:unnamed protein product [Amoebophrya sp. A120]|nr:unnamed protein product [Amoebophrya sp. A120]|eukprot:GSA120T00004222001.1